MTNGPNNFWKIYIKALMAHFFLNIMNSHAAYTKNDVIVLWGINITNL